MKIIICKNRIIITGKAWEIKTKLRKYSKKYHYLTEWLATVNGRQ